MICVFLINLFYCTFKWFWCNKIKLFAQYYNMCLFSLISLLFYVKNICFFLFSIYSIASIEIALFNKLMLSTDLHLLLDLLQKTMISVIFRFNIEFKIFFTLYEVSFHNHYFLNKFIFITIILSHEMIY